MQRENRWFGKPNGCLQVDSGQNAVYSLSIFGRNLRGSPGGYLAACGKIE